MIKTRLTLLIGILFPLLLTAQESSTFLNLKQTWEKPFSTASELIKCYQQNQAQIKKQDPKAFIYNRCFLLSKSGDYIMQKKGASQDIPQLVEQVFLPDLNDSTVLAFMETENPSTFTDYYYMLKALKTGVSFDDARDGISLSTQFIPRALNHCDYEKLKDIFSNQNEELHEIYLEKMKLLFRNNGCTDGMIELRPVIEKNIPESSLKNDILQLYNRYEKIRKGQPAPAPILKDQTDKAHRFNEFPGKVIVVDVWATWCCICVEKMPFFLKLRDEFHGNENVVFLSVSIDRSDAHAKWLKAVEENNMSGMLNLIIDSSEESLFERDYCIPSVPRYIVIDQEGKIVDAYAPSPDKELKQMIINTLKQ